MDEMIHGRNEEMAANQSVVSEAPSLYGQRVAVTYGFTLPSGEPCCLSVSAAQRQAVLGGASDDSFFDACSETSIPLYANYVWPGSLVLADHLLAHSEELRGKDVLELGAGTALPSLLACKLDARMVVTTDYPDPVVIDNMVALQSANHCSRMTVLPHQWGHEHETQHLKELSTDKQGFDLILLGEVLWKDTYKQHGALLASVSGCLKPTGVVLLAVVHRPTDGHTAENDLEFLRRAQVEHGMVSQLLSTCSRYKDAIEMDDAEVFLYQLQRS